MRPILWITIFGIALPLTAFVLSPDLRADDAKAAADSAIEKLIAQLGDDDFRTREQASKELAALGAKAKPALEKALKGAVSPEVRWRAEQVLRRINGSNREKPLGGATSVEGGKGGQAGQPGQHGTPRPGMPPMPGPKDVDEAMKRVEEMLKKWGRSGSSFGTLLGSRRISAPGLVLQRSLGGIVTLRVTREREDGTKVEDVFSGHSLEDILANNPELNDHAGMAELTRREAESDWPGMDDFRKQLEKQLGGMRVRPFPQGGFGMAMGSGVSIRQDADGVTVELRERGEDGKEVVKEYKGKSIEELKEKHPELKDKIGGFSIRVMPPQVFWPGRTPRNLNPLDRPTTPRARATGKAVFGLTLTDVSPALASHLGLAEGRGAIVDNVMPGSQAETMGVKRHDIILEVNGQGVGLNEAADLIRKAGADKAPLSLTIVRKGQRQTLTR